MIGRIAGTLLEKYPPEIVVDAGGVGYEISVPMSTFYNLPHTGEKVVLFTHLIVREDAHLLFGFGSASERALFRQLIKITGIGARMGAPDRLNEIWYQSFHQMPFAAELVGASRDSCRAYIGHFLRHWSHRKEAFDDVLELWVDNFMQPGNLDGGFAWYRAAHAGRMAMLRGDAPTLPPIDAPTCVRWAEHDAIFPAAWTDTLDETFTDLDLALLPGVGHFPHREDPDRAAAEIAGFFDRISWR